MKIIRSASEFGAISYLSHITPEPDSESNLLRPMEYKVTIEDGLLWLWVRRKRGGKVFYYGTVVKDLRLEQEK